MGYRYRDTARVINRQWELEAQRESQTVGKEEIGYTGRYRETGRVEDDGESQAVGEEKNGIYEQIYVERL